MTTAPQRVQVTFGVTGTAPDRQYTVRVRRYAGTRGAAQASFTTREGMFTADQLATLVRNTAGREPTPFELETIGRMARGEKP